MTYSTPRPAGRSSSPSVVFEPAQNAIPYTTIEVPRLEAEFVYTTGNTKLLGRRPAPDATSRAASTRPASLVPAWSGGARLGFKPDLAHRLGLLRQGHRHHADVPGRRDATPLAAPAAPTTSATRTAASASSPFTPTDSKVTHRRQLGHQLPQGGRHRAIRTSRPRTGWPPAASTTRPPSPSRSSASSTTP